MDTGPGRAGGLSLAFPAAAFGRSEHCTEGAPSCAPNVVHQISHAGLKSR
jgi:hypothetical protein